MWEKWPPDLFVVCLTFRELAACFIPHPCLPVVPWGWYNGFHDSQCAEEKAEAKRSPGSWPRSHRQVVIEPELEAGSPNIFSDFLCAPLFPLSLACSHSSDILDLLRCRPFRPGVGRGCKRHKSHESS